MREENMGDTFQDMRPETKSDYTKTRVYAWVDLLGEGPFSDSPRCVGYRWLVATESSRRISTDA